MTAITGCSLKPRISFMGIAFNWTEIATYTLKIAADAQASDNYRQEMAGNGLATASRSQELESNHL